MIDSNPHHPREMHPVTMLILTILVTFVSGFIFQLIAAATTMPLFNVRAMEALDPANFQSPEYIAALKWVQILGAIGTFIVSSLVLSVIYTGTPFGFFTAGKRFEGRSIVVLAVIMLAALPLVNWLTELNMQMHIPFEKIEDSLRQLDESTEELMMTLVKADNLGALSVNLLMIAIIPAVGEELLFRGLIQKHFEAWFKNGHAAVIVTSMVFSLMHLQIFAFLPRFFLGLVLGYFFYYGRSIWYPMIAHLLNNGLAVLFYYQQARGNAGESLDEIGTGEMMPAAALLSAMIVAGLFYVWLKMVRTESSG